MKKCHKLNNKVLKDFLVMINNKATNVNLYLDKKKQVKLQFFI